MPSKISLAETLQYDLVMSLWLVDTPKADMMCSTLLDPSFFLRPQKSTHPQLSMLKQGTALCRQVTMGCMLLPMYAWEYFRRAYQSIGDSGRLTSASALCLKFTPVGRGNTTNEIPSPFNRILYLQAKLVRIGS